MSLAYRKKGLKDGDLAAQARFTDIDCSKDKGLTTQADANEVDINKIVARVIKGQPVLTSAGEPFYGDVSEFGGLQEAIMKVQEAEELFEQFPADLREKFDNDPVKFVDYMSDPRNTDEAISLGLAKSRPEVVTPPVPEPGDLATPNGDAGLLKKA